MSQPCKKVVRGYFTDAQLLRQLVMSARGLGRDRRLRHRHGVALLLGTALRDDAERLRVLEIAPERQLRVAGEQVRRQDRAALLRLHLRANAVEPVEAELSVERRRVIFELVEV